MDFLFFCRNVLYFALVVGLVVTTARRDHPIKTVTDIAAIVFVVAGATGLQ